MGMGGWILVFKSEFCCFLCVAFDSLGLPAWLRLTASLGNFRSMFDISLIASIASHLSYWADEDVSHFMISQLLSRQRVVRR